MDGPLWKVESKSHGGVLANSSHTSEMQWNFITLSIRMIRASLNRGSRLGPKTSVQGKPCPSLGTGKFTSVFKYQGGKF